MGEAIDADEDARTTSASAPAQAPMRRRAPMRVTNEQADANGSADVDGSVDAGVHDSATETT